MDRVAELENALPQDFQSFLHVEVALKPESIARKNFIKERVKIFLYNQKVAYGDFITTEFDDDDLKTHVKSLALCDTDLNIRERQSIDLQSNNLKVHVFHLHEDGPSDEDLGDDSNCSVAQIWNLPSLTFYNMWDFLVFDEDIKAHLLNYAMTTLLFSDNKVNSNIISWNRVILLHGPPGTGKTSLCKALAQKISIQLSDRYSYGTLIELNSHGLFSKWFSESGKLVVKLFEKIEEIIIDNEALVFVLIDEVESLTAARKNSLNGNEPSDAIRVVNALLTKIDQIKNYSNVLILTTSNITDAIDLAFIDRADIKQYIGLPSPRAIFKIYHSCINELMRTGIISPVQQMLDIRVLEITGYADNDATKLSLQLLTISQKSYGLSGRTLRKMPFIAHALYLRVSSSTLEVYLEALDKAVDNQFTQQNNLCKDN
ncbi:pachytene checkpoint protein 2 homolog [Octopus sinensis]|uniref:Pachytene checkpoint protein 2 homolog n=1 Tax=Octopus sinensis TaxID=2607531 RepID=A0A6P7S6D5_9MOLL|nr:pachytene checkpoint protein 2 homolog [Octopus sinensis]XP_036357176.1 pachytene checkpoint protein 2 homolog [Octopus sinensis]XP_036357177.1 pachytene checkpoint protein 2 homolog [Octopus sinensis]